MPLIDDRGRLWGKVNLIDAGVGLLFLLLIPLGYGAYVLFRAPAPEITAVKPNTLNEGKDLRVQLRGRNLRPFLRAFIGTHETQGFLIESPNLAELKLPDLAAGTYDLVLYDEAHEVARRPGALTIVAPPPPPPPPPPPSAAVQVRGTFTGLDKEGVRALAVGTRFPAGGQPPLAEVLALQPPEPVVERVKVAEGVIIATPLKGKVQVPAILRLRCVLVKEGCKVGDTLVAPGGTLSLPKPGGGLPFVVEEIRPVEAPVAFPPVPPVRTVQVRGTFTDLDKEGARTLVVGTRFPAGGQPPLAEVLALQPPEPAVERVKVGEATIITPVEGKVQVPAILRLRCVLAKEGCKVGDALVTPGGTLPLPKPGGVLPFVVGEIRPVEAPVAFPKLAVAEVLIRFVARPEVLALVKVGDIDQWGFAAGNKRTATLTALKGKQELASRTMIDSTDVGIGVMEVEERLTAFEAVLRVPVQETPAGWQYKAKPVKVGAAFTFEAALYSVRGSILQIISLQSSTGAGEGRP